MPNEPRQRFEHVKVLAFETEAVTKEAAQTPAGRPALRIRGWASTPALDRDNEVIEPGFFDASLPSFMANPQMYWMHGWGDTQGKWDTIRSEPGKGYWVEGSMIDLGTPEDTRRMAMVEEGLVKSLSVGFNARRAPETGEFDEGGIWHWQRGGSLMEVSLCTIPCNPDATFQLAKALGMPLPALDEDDQVSNYLQRLSGAAEWLRNRTVHWDKDGGAPSAEVVSAALSPLSDLCAVVKAGRVLSAANRTAVDSAVSALQEVCARDDASRGGSPEPDADGDEDDAKCACPGCSDVTTQPHKRLSGRALAAALVARK